ncbi:MAG: PilZ domain-containing protein [Candidatus Omnitrophica bacterium]|nr:PilZ domain-containing protein [Candidatus Omnitrophota bacterium]MDD5429729.1 PilZ domain-containing protein [Candidatus Omnitrophota bacterium]
MDERRKYPRIDVSFPVECQALPSQGYFYTVSKDLSEVGAKILTNTFIAKNNMVKLHLNLINKILDFKAKVVWCNKERVSERYTAGLEFTETDTAGKKELSNFISKINNS